MKKLFSFKDDLSPLLALALPLAFTGMVQSSSYFFETLFLAHLGKDVLAAGALVSWLFATIAVVLFGTLSSINILVSHKYGAKDNKGIQSVTRDGLLLAIVFSVVIFFLCWNMAPILLFLGQTNSVVLLAQAYLRALAWGIMPSFIMIAIFEIMVGLGHARIMMVFSIFAVALTIIFSYLLIFGKMGFPALGIAGAGWGLTISNIVTTCFLGIYVLSHKKLRVYFQAIFNFKTPSFLIELIKIGLPIGLMYCVEVGFFLALTLLMGTLGTELLAANQIAMQYLGLLISMIFSIAQAITVRMGHLIGAKEFDSVARTAYLGASISAILMTLAGIIFWGFPAILISFDFNIHDPKNADLLRLTEQLLMISPVFQIFEAIRISLFGALRALKDTHFTLGISIISFWGISLPIGYVFAKQLQLGGQGLWWGMVLGVIASVFMLFWRFRSKMQHLYKFS
jgi:MATE family multidrug resistance protein